MNESDEIFGTTHFVEDQNDPLYEYSDACMHRNCFLDWEKRTEFVEKYNSLAKRWSREILTEAGEYVRRKPWWKFR